MSEALPVPDQVEREIEKLLNKKRQQRLLKYDRDALAWLALIPAWTGQLAQACKFPSKQSLLDFLEQAQEDGYCQLSRSKDPKRSAWYDTYVRTHMAPYLPIWQQKEVVAFVQQINDAQLRAQALTTLAACLCQDLVPDMLLMAQEIEDAYTRANILLTLLPRLPKEQHSNTLQTVQNLAGNMTDVEEHAKLLVRLISIVTEDERQPLMQQILDLVIEIADEEESARLLVGAIPYLPQALLLFPLKSINALTSSETQMQVYLVLAKHASRELRSFIAHEAYAAISRMGKQGKKAQERLSSFLSQLLALTGQFDEALRVANTLLDENTRVYTFTCMAQIMAESGEGQHVAYVTNLLRNYTLQAKDPAQGVSILTGLALALAQAGEQVRAESLVHEALNRSQELKPAPQHLQVLSSLVRTLVQTGEGQDTTRKTLLRAFACARLINDARDRCKAFTSLVQYTSPDYPQEQEEVKEILATARVISDIGDRIMVLVNVAPYLSSQELSRVMDEALELAKLMAEEFSFWMPDVARKDVLYFLSREYGLEFLLKTVQRLGPLLLKQQEDGLPIVPAVVRWAELATAASREPADAAKVLDKRLERLVNAGDTGEALAWVNTAMSLVPVLRGEMETIALLGNRRIELAYRRVQDERSLQDFIYRAEQIEDFRQLIETQKPDAAWALHYVGTGGIGKTTLIRYITATLAPQMGIPTVRVDFDYLKPDYPLGRPGQLLLELAEELQSYPSRNRRLQESRFSTFRDKVVRFHEKLSNEILPANPLTNVHHPDFEEVVLAFNEYLSLFSGTVLLILDTCEELPKFQLAGVMPANVEATFTILERVHDGVPSVRIIFAGRRLLVQSGAGWSLKKEYLQTWPSLLHHKAYLQLHQMKGFTQAEAREFLLKRRQLNPSDEQLQAIFKRSSMVDLDVSSDNPTNSINLMNSIEWNEPRIDKEEERYNPFKLSLYSDWMREDPNLSLEALTRGETDPFIEMRIIHRIKRDDVLDVMPAAILLRRFDREMLRSAFHGSEDAFAEAFRYLGTLEWIAYKPEEDTTFLEIDRNLHPQLLAYYQHIDRQWLLEKAQRALIPGLFRLVTQLDLSRLRVEYVEAALRLLPEDQGALLWDRLTQRLNDAGDWERANRFTERLLDDSAPVVGIQHKARAAVRSTNIAVMLHEKPELNVDDFWKEVASVANAEPNPAVRSWLQQRAFVGRISTIRIASGSRSSSEVIEQFWKLLAQFPQPISLSVDADLHRVEQFAGSLCSAIEALVERAEQTQDRSLIPDPGLLADWAMQKDMRSLTREVQAFATMLAGKSMALHGRWDDAKRLFERACDLLAGILWSQHQRWADWLAPSSLHDRIRLEYISTIPRHLLTISQDTLLAWQKEAKTRLDSIDADRLVASLLTWRLSIGLVSIEELNALEPLDIYRLERRPQCNVHFNTPPLFVVRALALLALGEATKALELLEEQSGAALVTAHDEATVEAAELAKVHVLRRMRMSREQPTLVENLAQSTKPDELALIWPFLALATARAIPFPSSTSQFLIHAWWHSQAALTKESTRSSVETWYGLLPGGLPQATENSSYESLSLLMDEIEVELLEKRKIETRSFLFNPEDWFNRYPTQVEQGLRLLLRSYALDILPTKSEKLLPTWATRVGERYMAELALDEGELLALRLPEQGAYLLRWAYERFVSLGDTVGTFIAFTCLTIATIHTRISFLEEDARKAWLQTLSISYKQLTDRALMLLPWADVMESPQALPSTLAEKIDPAWRGWTERLVSCVLYIHNMDHPEVFASWTRDWLVPQYGTQIPVEMDFTVVNVEEEAGTTTSSVLSERSSLVLGLSVILLVLGLIGLLFYGGYWLFNLLFLRLSNLLLKCTNSCTSIDTFWKVLIYIGILIVLALITRGGYRLVQRLRAKLARRTSPDLDIIGEGLVSTEQREESKTMPVTMRLRQYRLVLRLNWPVLRRIPKVVEGQLELSGTQEYSNASKTLPAKITKELSSLQKQLGRQHLQIPLHVHSGLQTTPWEAFLTLGLTVAPKPTTGGWQETFQFWRSGETLPPSQAKVISEVDRAIGALSDPNWGLLLEQGWEPAKLPVITCSSLPELEKLGKSFLILHVVGTPVATSAGWRLRIGNTYRQYYDSSMKVEAAVRGTDGSVLIRAEKLPVTSAALVIIQAEPIEVTTRSNSERQQTADLRGYTASVFLAGARTVIMLPMLPPQLSELVLKELANCWAKQPSPAFPMVLDAVTNVRRLIAQWAPPREATDEVETSSLVDQITPEALLELALDVSTFMRLPSE